MRLRLFKANELKRVRVHDLSSTHSATRLHYFSPTVTQRTKRPFYRQFPGTHSLFIVSESDHAVNEAFLRQRPVNSGEPAFC